MARFEVFIPASGPGSFDLTFRVEADNWLAALNTGLKKIGEKGGVGANLLVDIQDDNSIHVTDPKSSRVFRITESQEPSPFPSPPPGNDTLIETSPFDPLPLAQTQREMPAVVAPPPDPVPVTPPAARPKAAPSTAPARPRARKPSSTAERVIEVPRSEVKAPPGKIGRAPAPPGNIDEVLAELFERVQELEAQPNPEEAMNFLLDLAMEKISSESGSIFLADLSSNDLNLGAARGPKSKDLLRMNPRVPMGVGIVGYCAQDGIALAISDAQRDPRFFRAISDRLGYETRTILCAPMSVGGRIYGCLEVINKKASSRFTENELAILSYLSEQGGRYLSLVG